MSSVQVTHGVGTNPAGTKNHTASWWDCFVSCCFIGQERSLKVTFYFEICIIYKFGLFLLSPEGSVGFVLCYSSVRRSLCWKLTFILSPETPTDNHLVSFIFLCLVFLSPCNNHCVHGPPSFVSVSFVRGHYSPLTLRSLPYFYIFTDSLSPTFIPDEISTSSWYSWFMSLTLLMLIERFLRAVTRTRTPTCLHLAAWCVCCLPFNCELSVAKPSGYKLVIIIPRNGWQNEDKKGQWHLGLHNCDRSSTLHTDSPYSHLLYTVII